MAQSVTTVINDNLFQMAQMYIDTHTTFPLGTYASTVGLIINQYIVKVVWLSLAHHMLSHGNNKLSELKQYNILIGIFRQIKSKHSVPIMFVAIENRVFLL